MKSTAEARIYKFDDLFLSLLRTTLIQRKSPNSPFELRGPRLMSFLIVLTFVTTVTITISIIILYQRANLADVSGDGALVGVFLIIVLRAIALLAHRDGLNRLLATLEELFPVSAEHQLNYSLHKFAKSIIRRNKIMSLLMSNALFAYTLKPPLISAFNCVFRGQKYAYMYPFMDSFLLHDTHQLVWYVTIFGLHMAGGVAGILVYFYEDLMFTSSVTQLSMHYQFIGQSLSGLDAKKEFENHRKLRKIIRLQNTLTSLRDDVNMSFSLSTFFVFGIVKLSICMFLFSLVDADRIDLTNILPYSLSIFSLTIPVYQRCYLGTELYEDSLSIMNSIYDSNWYDGSPRYRKFLVFMMIRANVPIELQASPLNCIGIEYFKELVIQTYQFLMFLINFLK